MKKQLKIGAQASCKRSFSLEEIISYLKISGDTNPIHHDPNYASETPFQKCIVPGIMVGSLIGGLLGSELPGKGTIHLGQTMNFKKPVYIDNEVVATIEVTNIRKDKPIITFKTICQNSNGDIVIEGEAVVKYS